jgi:sulfatase maturation enzyme AslB (radical SAM superfamily)
MKHAIEVTTKIGCSNVCEYCPQSTLIKRYRERIGHDKDTMMSLETFEKCISTMPTDIGLNFTGYVEPYLNPECTDMIIHAFDKGHELLLNTTLMGMKIADWDKLRNRGVVFQHGVHVHLPSASYFEMIGKQYLELDDDYYETLNHVVNFPLPRWTKFHCHGDLHPLLKDLERYTDIDVRNINSRAMNILLEKKEKVPDEINIRGKCPRAYQNVLLPDGSLGLCCQDYGLDDIMGNLVDNTWDEFVNSERVQDVRTNGADLCDYCEEGIDYVGDKENQWRRPQQIK